MFQTLLIEDEQPAARRLERLLKTRNIQVLSVLHTIKESVKWLQNHPCPELIFLDIHLSDGISFEIFEQVQVNSSIIFTTAFDKYTLRAFKLNSVDYLLKPIDEKELDQAIEKYAKHKSPLEPLDKEKIEALLQNISASYKTRFTVKVGQKIKIINQRDIVCFLSEDKSSYVHTKENRSYPLESTLDSIEQKINPKTYFRINRGFIVRMDCISDIVFYSNNRLIIHMDYFKGKEMVVARERVGKFKSWVEG